MTRILTRRPARPSPRNPQAASGRTWIRACRSLDREASLTAQTDRLAASALGERTVLLRALRASRRAALRGGPDYDPARHAALLRLVKRKAPP